MPKPLVPTNATTTTKNRIIKAANETWTFGCFLHSGDYILSKRKRTMFRSRLVTGVARDGRAILLFIMVGSRRVPAYIANILKKYEDRGGIVGSIFNVEDAWEVLYNGEEPRKRKARTYEYRRFIREEEE